MWLLDVNMPKKVASLLGGFGLQAQCADDRGWGDLTNGALVEAAVQAGFQCLLTRSLIQRVGCTCAEALSDSSRSTSRQPVTPFAVRVIPPRS